VPKRAKEAESLLQRALSATRETQHIEFKATFNPSSKESLCETIKDILALANSGGGVIVVGVDNHGTPLGTDIKGLLDTDPADLVSKVSAYIGGSFDGLTVKSHAKAGRLVATVEVAAASVPLIPVRPGTYPKSEAKQGNAFSVGVIYVRHGAKSEPATSQDFERIIERRLREIRSSWLKGLRRVVSAPKDAEIVVTRRVPVPAIAVSGTAKARPVRVTTDPTVEVVGVADPEKSYPYRLTELLSVVNPQIKALGIKAINIHDVRAIIAIHGKGQPWIWEPSYSPKRYSDVFAQWLVKEATKDRFLFQRMRGRFRRMPQ
jgi:hypothetical protein